MRLAIILVHYHTPILAAEAAAALRLDMEKAGIEGEILLIDNGSDPVGREILASLPVRYIDSGENLGYAGGVNLGVSSTEAEVVVLVNPDVLVLPGCLATLLAEIESGTDIAGPLFYWDRGCRLSLPPAEERTRRGELLSLLAWRNEFWALKARHSWRRAARRHWEAPGALPSYDLSGSLLALRRSAWERVGPFDPAYRLFFEETDWLSRARRAGLSARYVPAARAIHLYNQSAGLEPKTREWFEASAERFRRQHYGTWFATLLRGTAEVLPSPWEPTSPPLLPRAEKGLDLAGLGRDFPLWVEVSPNPTGFPAAAEKIVDPGCGVWRLPAEITAQYSGGGLVVQVTDAAGEEILRGSLPSRPAGEAGDL